MAKHCNLIVYGKKEGYHIKIEFYEGGWDLKVSISARKVAIFLSSIVILLIFASLSRQFSKYYLGYHRIFELISFLDVNNDGGICTWYSTVVLLFSSILLATIRFAKIKAGASNVIYWTVFSVVFLFLSLDEASGIHNIAFDLLFTNEHYHFTWVVPGAIFAIIFGLSFLKFLFNLPPKTRYLFLFAGLIFVSGSIGIETIANEYFSLGKDAYVKNSYDPGSMTYAVMSTFEEFLEMIGIVIFIYALIDYINACITREVILKIEN